MARQLFQDLAPMLLQRDLTEENANLWAQYMDIQPTCFEHLKAIAPITYSHKGYFILQTKRLSRMRHHLKAYGRMIGSIGVASYRNFDISQQYLDTIVGPISFGMTAAVLSAYDRFHTDHENARNPVLGKVPTPYLSGCDDIAYTLAHWDWKAEAAQKEICFHDLSRLMSEVWGRSTYEHNYIKQ